LLRSNDLDGFTQMRPKDDLGRRAFRAAVLIASLAVGGQASHAKSVNYTVYTLSVGDSPSSLATGVMFDGHYIWVAVQNPDGGALVKMNTSGAVLSTTGVGDNPDEMAFDGTNVWVTDFTSNDVTIVDSSGNLVKTIPLAPSTNPAGPANPEGIVFDGKSIWVANDGPYMNSVSKFDVASQSLVGTYPVGLAPDSVAFDGTYIWVANSDNNNVWFLDRNTGDFVNGNITYGLFPTDMVWDGTYMWVANGVSPALGYGSLTKMSAAGQNGFILGPYKIGNQVRGLTHDATSIWACNAADNTVSRLRSSNAVFLGTFPVGVSPRGAAFDGTKIWIANSGEGTLTIIVPPETMGKAAASTAQAPLSAAPSVTVTQAEPSSAAAVAEWLKFILDN